MAYDAAHRQVVLFSGDTISDTWLWDGHTWHQAHPPTSPPARSAASMAYDAATRQVVLFGGVGVNGATLGDTWTWGGSTWTQQHPGAAPSARGSASMAYDAAHQQIVLFGGEAETGGHVTAAVRDTWTWDGSTWTQQHPAASPAARYFASMAYDTARQRTLLFGGYADTAGGVVGDTWAWDGAGWVQLHPATAPAARASSSLVYDMAAQRLVLVGGGTAATPFGLAETWTWDGTTWAQVDAAGAQPTGPYLLAAYDDAMSDVVVYGTPRVTGPSQTWLWNGSAWAVLT